MQAELEEVLLNKGELKRWVELDSFRYHAFVYYVIILSLIATPKTERKGELNASIQAFGDRALSPFLEIIFKLLLFLVESLKLQDFLNKRGKYITLVNLLTDVKNHNQVIYRIQVLDELSSVGNKVSLDDRQTVLDALNITKNNIIQALKTDKILRQNPGFKPDRFAVDLASMRSLQVQEKSSEYGSLLNEALQIGISLQDELEGRVFKNSSETE
mgnify:CR=1 FL=1